MPRFARTAAAAATALAVCGGTVVAADADVAVREAHTYWKQTCAWLVDENGDVLLDSEGKWMPSLGPDGKQRCRVEAVPQGAVKERRSSDSAEAQGSSAQDGPGQPNWSDAGDGSFELGVGAVVGIVGAVVAAIVGIGWLFVDALNVRVLPPRR